jgi:hypothetical protein
MQHWIVATLEGACLGLALYFCVRLRMYVGPMIRKRFGHWVHRSYWLLTILIMIILGNAGLYIFRAYLHNQSFADETLPLELYFATTTLLVGLALIFRKIVRN